MGDYMKRIYEMTDSEILEELFSGMTAEEVNAYIEKVYTYHDVLTPAALRKEGLL